MKTIPFSTNKWTDDTHFLIDDEDYDRVIKHSWCVDNKTSRYPNRKQKYYIQSRIKNKTILLGRFIMNVSDPKIKVDHLNGWLDHTKKSLNLVNNQQNSWRSEKRIDNTSGYKGVSSSGRKKKPYRATIEYNQKSIHLGCFSTKEEAALAYNMKATELFKEHALLNQIPGGNNGRTN